MFEFHAGDEVTVKIPEFTDKTTGKVFPAEEWVGRVISPDSRCMISRLPGMEVKMPDGGTAHIDPAWATPYVKPVRTPLTEENLLKWADEFVRQSPEVADLNGKKVTNSVEHVLCQILISADVRSYSGYGRSDLLQLVLDWCHGGVKGYSQMAREELLGEVRKQFMDHYCEIELNDLDGLLEFANLNPNAGKPALEWN